MSDSYNNLISSKDLQKLERKLGVMKKKAPLVVSRALNKAISSLNTGISKETRKEYYVKAKGVRASLETHKARVSRLSAQTISKGKKLGLKDFKIQEGIYDRDAPENSTPLKVSVKKRSGGLKEIMNAFIVEKLSGHVFERRGKKRLPLDKLEGPSIPQMINNEDIRKKISDDAWDVYQEQIKVQLNRVLESK